MSRRVSTALLVAASLYAGDAWSDARTEARSHFEGGMQLIADGNYDKGIAELERAYEILPHPAVRFNIARAHQDADAWDKAIESYEAYLESDPEDRAAVEKLVRELRGKIAKRDAAPVEPEPLGPQPTKPTAPAPTVPTSPVPDTSGLYEESVVTASRQAQSPLDAPNALTVITRQDIRLSGITRIPELLRRVAGADVMQITGGDSNVSLRGLNRRLSNKLLVLINGRPIKNDILGSTFWEAQTIDVDQVERIEVVRGPGSSLYGADAFAGVVNIITIEPGEGGTGFRAGYGDRNQAYGSLWATGRDGDFAYRGSAGYTRYPRWTREVGPGRVDLEQSGVDQDIGAANARVDVRGSYRVGKGKSLTFGGGFARSSLDIYGIGPFNDYVVDADLVDIAAGYASDIFNARTTYNLLDARASANANYRGHFLYEAYPFQHSFATDVEVTPSFDFPKPLHHDLIAGVNYRLKKIDWNYLIDEPPIEHHVGLFAQDAMGFLDRFKIILSGRLDYVPSLENVVPSARGTFIVKPGEAKKQAIRASVATAFRSPTFLESYLELPIQLPLSGLELQSSSRRDDDPNFVLGAENVLAAELGYLNQESDLFRADAQFYYHRISDFIELAPPRPTTLSDLADGIGGINPETGQYRVASGGWQNRCSIDHVVGAELGGRFYGVEGLDVFANYAFNHSFQELPVGCIVPEDRRTSQHKINVGTQVRTPFGLDGEITFHYQSDQVWGEQVATLDGIVVRLFELEGYHLLNGRLGYSFLERKASVSFVVFNALSGVFGPAPQMHPFGNRVGRRFMGFMSYQL